MIIVFARGMSMPFSIMVVATSTPVASTSATPFRPNSSDRPAGDLTAWFASSEGRRRSEAIRRTFNEALDLLAERLFLCILGHPDRRLHDTTAAAAGACSDLRLLPLAQFLGDGWWRSPPGCGEHDPGCPR